MWKAAEKGPMPFVLTSAPPYKAQADRSLKRAGFADFWTNLDLALKTNAKISLGKCFFPL